MTGSGLAASDTARKAPTNAKKVVKKKATTAKKPVKKPVTKKATPKKTVASKTSSQQVKKEKAKVERELAQLRRRHDQQTRERNAANEQLKAAEEAINKTARHMRALEGERHGLKRELKKLESREAQLEKQIADEEAHLAAMARAQFLNARKSPWQTFLEGTHPSRLLRDRAALTYLNSAKQKALTRLDHEQTRVQSVAKTRQDRRDELTRLEQETQRQHKRLVLDKSRRESALESLQADIQHSEANMAQLEANQKKLGALMENLERAAQTKARAKAKREAQLKARREAQAKAKAKTKTPTQKTTPQVAKTESAPTPERQKVKGVGFARQKGRLPSPIAARITENYTTQRPGLFFKAKEGTDVKAIAQGRVVFADWMRGFGNLVIVDHGDAYMTVYASNESVYKKVGDTVKQGETISAAGVSGGRSQAGLYFEIRHRGKPINPRQWLKR